MNRPPEATNVAEPREPLGPWKVTVRVGMPAPGAFTVTVAVRVAPLAERFVDVDALPTVNATALGVVLALKVALPAYWAVNSGPPE